MESGPTRGATEIERGWGRSPVASFLVRATAHLLPVVAAWLGVRLLSGVFFRPAGWIGAGAWIVQATIVAVATSAILDRFTRRLLPLATLLNLSLIFPDQAPSRFGVALRAGSAKRLQERIDEIAANGLGDTAAEAAAQALELVAALGQHDRRTRGHTERVRAYAQLIAEELDLPEADRLRLAWGVLLHDVGKLTVPPEVLNKVGKLTDDEWSVLKGHPHAGARLLAPMADWLGDWVLAAGEHHERWDGKGYPLGLAGTDISLAGRITAVADAYDVITSKRSYKEPMSVEAARQELVRCAGTQFDPAVVRAFLTASVARRWSGGPLAWLVELPSLGQIGSSIGGAAATATVAGVTTVAAVTSGAVTLPDAATPDRLAFVSDEHHDESELSKVTTTVVQAETGPAAPSDSTAPAPLAPTSTAPPESTVAGAPSTSTTLTAGPLATTTSTTTSPDDTKPPRSTTTSTTAAPTTTTTAPPTTTTTTAPPPTPLALWLTNPGTGDTASSSELPLTDGFLVDIALPNYDTNRNKRPGLSIQHEHGNGYLQAERKRQDWTWTAPDSLSLAGSGTVVAYVAEDQFEGGTDIGVHAELSVCNPTCTPVASGSWTGVSAADTFVPATIDLGKVNATMAPGAWLRLRLYAPDTVTDHDIALAYDTVTFASQLTIG